MATGVVWLADAIRKDTPYRVNEVVEDGAAFLAAVKEAGLEGIMAKQRDSGYLPGKRSDTWLKIKTHQTVECAIIGYTQGRGERELTFGALHIARSNGGELEYIGKVGTGFDEPLMRSLAADLAKLSRIKRPLKEKVPDEAKTVWVEPKLTCEVQFGSFTEDGLLREPVFLRMRPDLTAE